MQLSVSIGDFIISGALGVLTWQAASLVNEVRRLAVRVTHLEAWAAARFDSFKPAP